MKKLTERMYERILLDLRDVKIDIGFQSRYSAMTEDYEPIVRRVSELEKKLDLIFEHLKVELVKERYVLKGKK